MFFLRIVIISFDYFLEEIGPDKNFNILTFILFTHYDLIFSINNINNKKLVIIDN